MKRIKRELTLEQYELIRQIFDAIENCFNDSGELVDEYYNNIILSDIKKEDLDFIQNF